MRTSWMITLLSFLELLMAQIELISSLIHFTTLSLLFSCSLMWSCFKTICI